MSVLSVPGGALVGGVELAAEQGDQGDQVHPDEKRDAGADGAIHHVVAGQIAHVPGESQGGEEPQNGGQRGAAPDGLPALFAVGAVVVELSLIHISEPTRLGMISYAVFCLKKKK